VDDADPTNRHDICGVSRRGIETLIPSLSMLPPFEDGMSQLQSYLFRRSFAEVAARRSFARAPRRGRYQSDVRRSPPNHLGSRTPHGIEFYIRRVCVKELETAHDAPAGVLGQFEPRATQNPLAY
jgi:hypothetical protein